MILPPIYCITMREEPWKQELASAHFQELGLSVKFIWGFYGVTAGLKPTNPYDVKADATSTFLHPASLGCLVSHRMALTLAIANGDPTFIICEDDVQFDPDFRAGWAVIQEQEADVIQLEHCQTHDKSMVSYGPLSTCYPYPFCAACIWWTREAAMKAIALMRPLDRAYDIMLIERVYPFLKHYIADPPLARQKSNHYGEAVGPVVWPSSIGTAMRE